MAAPMYTLTKMTGREASAQRTVIFATIEFNPRVLWILLLTLPVSLLVAALLWPLLQSVALLAIPIVEAAAVWLFHWRSSDGLQLRTYQRLWDKHQAAVGKFFICGQEVNPNLNDWGLLTRNDVAYEAPKKRVRRRKTQPKKDTPEPDYIDASVWLG